MNFIKKKLFRNKEGSATAIAIMSLFIIMIVAMGGVIALDYSALNVKVEGVQDDLAYSNLATYKNVDMSLLAYDDSNLEIDDTSGALNTFEEYLKNNMKLDRNMDGLKGSIADGHVNIDELTFYNVDGNTVKILSYNKNTGSFIASTEDKSKTTIRTSNNKIITNSCVHSTIDFDVDLPFGIKKMTTVSTDTDITR